MLKFILRFIFAIVKSDDILIEQKNSRALLPDRGRRPAFIKFATSPAMRAVWKSKGVDRY